MSAAQAGDAGCFLANSPAHQAWAGAGVAAPRDSSWVHLNPAGLVRVESRADAWLTSIYMHSVLHSRGLGANWTADRLNDRDQFFAGGAGAVFASNETAWGVSIVPHAGAGVTFPESRSFPGLILGNRDRRVTYQQARLGLGYAWQAGEGWSVGVGMHASLTRLRTDHLTLGFVPTQGDYVFDYSAGAGFTLGVLKQWERFALGASYTSREWSQAFDRYSDLFRTTVDMPQFAQAGARWDIAQRWSLLVDLRWIDWSGIPLFGGSPERGELGRPDTWSLKWGVEWRVSPKWTLRAGYSRTLDSAIAPSHVFFNGLLPTVTTDHCAAGFSWRCGKQDEVQFAWIHACPKETKEAAHDDLFSILGYGTRLSNQYDLLSVGISHRF